DAGNVVAKLARNSIGILVRDETEAELGDSARRDYAFHSRTGVSSDDAVEAERWSDCRALVERVSILAPGLIDVGVGEDFGVARACASHVVALAIAPFAN